MQFSCKSLKSWGRNPAVLIAIYSSILFNSNSHRSSHLSPSLWMTAALALLMIGIGAVILCRKRHSA